MRSDLLYDVCSISYVENLQTPNDKPFQVAFKLFCHGLTLLCNSSPTNRINVKGLNWSCLYMQMSRRQCATEPIFVPPKICHNPDSTENQLESNPQGNWIRFAISQHPHLAPIRLFGYVTFSNRRSMRRRLQINYARVRCLPMLITSRHANKQTEAAQSVHSQRPSRLHEKFCKRALDGGMVKKYLRSSRRILIKRNEIAVQILRTWNFSRSCPIWIGFALHIYLHRWVVAHCRNGWVSVLENRERAPCSGSGIWSFHCVLQVHTLCCLGTAPKS